jgi:hypothetical protein
MTQIEAEYIVKIEMNSGDLVGYCCILLYSFDSGSQNSQKFLTSYKATCAKVV